MPAAPARVTLATKSNPDGFYSEKGAAFLELRGPAARLASAFPADLSRTIGDVPCVERSAVRAVVGGIVLSRLHSDAGSLTLAGHLISVEVAGAVLDVVAEHTALHGLD